MSLRCVPILLDCSCRAELTFFFKHQITPKTRLITPKNLLDCSNYNAFGLVVYHGASIVYLSGFQLGPCQGHIDRYFW
jgi:hypothetical protein